MGDDADFLLHLLLILANPFGLVRGNQPALQFFLVRGDPCRAGVLVALERLNTAQRKHKTSRRSDEVGTIAKSGRQLI